MNGILLSEVKDDLLPVEDDFSTKPVETLTEVEQKLAKHLPAILRAHNGKFDFFEYHYQLPVWVLDRFTFDEICKMHYSSVISPHESVDELFRYIPPYSIVAKIMSSMWRYGFTRGTWNAVVEYYNSIRSFRFTDNPDFVVTLDHTPWVSAFSYAKYTDGLYLDGAFGFLVHYKGKHVMTIGFSLLDENSVLIQQIQLRQKTGNRFLYQLPPNRVELVLDLFHRYFPRKKIHIVEGQSLVDKNLFGYTSALNQKIETLEKESSKPRDSRIYSPEYLGRVAEEIRELEEKIRHLSASADRIVQFYHNIGRYEFAKTDRIGKFRLTFRELAS